MSKKKRTPTKESTVKREVRTPQYRMKVEKDRKKEQKKKGYPDSDFER